MEFQYGSCTHGLSRSQNHKEDQLFQICWKFDWWWLVDMDGPIGRQFYTVYATVTRSLDTYYKSETVH